MKDYNIIFEYHDVSASESLESFTKEKLNAIFTKFDFVIRADVFFKSENTSENIGKICGIRLSAPGPRLFAETSSYNFQDAVTETVRDLTSQLKRRKEMMKTY